ncbi:Rrf2 family transcriptional regulator [Sphingopyxis sp.]|uniref:RrF2 family transcriptional regulator n=1 Tax=Sphingopyxis sp. TaxID=1908224 RepID=UPI0025FCD140|nr:Rrf2 family transcriptional regulator [Sphingopyxis sp.]
MTSYTNYALRILMYCALHPDQVVRIEDVSAAYRISKAHLMKATRQLGQLGYLENIRGRTGGVRLGMTPDKIIIGEVVRHTEGDLALVECFAPATNQCPLIGVCMLTGVFQRGLRAFLYELDQVKLSDLIGPAPALRARLSGGSRESAKYRLPDI